MADCHVFNLFEAQIVAVDGYAVYAFVARRGIEAEIAAGCGESLAAVEEGKCLEFTVGYFGTFYSSFFGKGLATEGYAGRDCRPG